MQRKTKIPMKKIIFMLSLMTASTFAIEADKKVLLNDKKERMPSQKFIVEDSRATEKEDNVSSKKEGVDNSKRKIPQKHSLASDESLETPVTELTQEFFFPIEDKSSESSIPFRKNTIKTLISSEDTHIVLQRSPFESHDSLYVIKSGEKPVLISKGYSYPHFEASNYNPMRLMILWSNISSFKPFKKDFYVFDTTNKTNSPLTLKDTKEKTLALDRIYVDMSAESPTDIFVLGGIKFVEDRDEYWVNTITKGWSLITTDSHSNCCANYTMNHHDSSLVSIRLVVKEKLLMSMDLVRKKKKNTFITKKMAFHIILILRMESYNGGEAQHLILFIPIWSKLLKKRSGIKIFL
jgi:hypothetical protein